MAAKRKRRTLKKQIGRAKKTEKQLLKAMKANADTRGNVFQVPAVKRAMKLHDKALKFEVGGTKAERRAQARRTKRYVSRK
jgi:hypothetical protein